MGGSIKGGTTSVSTIIRIVDSTTGLPETAVEHDTSGIDLWYRRDVDPGSTPLAKISITEAALAALTTAHADGGIEHIGDGYYRLDLPDAAFAVAAIGVQIGGTVTGMMVIGNYYPIVDYDPNDAVRMGLTALPDAAADAAGGLPISDDGGLDIDVVAVTGTAVGTDGTNLVEAGGDGDHLTAIAAVGDVTNLSNIPDIPANWITAAGIANAAIDNATFAADVGSTAYATNIIALAGRKVLDELNLDHILKVAVAGTDVVDNTLWADLVSKEVTSDYDDYDNTTDSLQGMRDQIVLLQTDLDTLTAGVTLANGAITDISLAGGMEIVFETDFGTNYNTVTNAWETNLTDTIGTLDAAQFGADFITAAKIADNAIATEHLATGAITAATLGADTITAAKVAPDVHAESADANWDELMSAHQVDGSFGLANNVIDAGTAQAGANGTITLDAGELASATADLLNGALITLVGGTGVGQTRRITDYSTTTLIASVEPDWITNPASGTKYIVSAGGNANLRTATQTSVDAIETDTAAMQPEVAKFVFTNANELDVNTKSINDAEVVGDGNSTPWDGA